MHSGVPVVLPPKTPLSISKRSLSRLAVSVRPEGRRRASSRSIFHFYGEAGGKAVDYGAYRRAVALAEER